MSREVVSTFQRPDLAPLVAEWMWGEFWRNGGATRDEALVGARRTIVPEASPRTYVMMRGDLEEAS